MNYRHNTLLAGTATLALVVGTALAFAQQPSQDQAPQTKQPHATQQMSQTPPAGKMGQRAQDQNHAQDQNRGAAAAHDETKSGKTVQNRDRMERHNTAQDQDRMKGHRAAEGARQPGRNGLEGLQGNASGMHAPLSDAQRTQIRNTVIDARGAPRVGQVNFDVTVGTAIPRGRIRVIPVPETLVRIEPAWRGLLYFVYEDEVVIVSPRDMKIVAVVPA
jgi:Protein of unknown function (DUF1236)